ncbi:MAG: 3-hydroxyacyl-CoA dehydrogenase [Desulfobacca sp. RBG_16_60_12]|nr:MAG: 3-hydroxyacyl-CoA dehydrogenase [Desulfobacca sp. RBG_16_60_12]
MTTVERICVVGAGNMGHQIALCAAIAGFKVRCTDVSAEVLQRAEQFAATYLPERVKKGRLTEEQVRQARANIAFVPSLEIASEGADLVIEAVSEKLDLKRQIFAELDRCSPPHAILATNSSFIVSSEIADATRRPGQVVNMHFFNPALVMKVVEVVQGPHVTDATAATVIEVAKQMGKIPVLLKREVYGFLVNRILGAINREAFWLYERGIASYEDIDLAVVNGLGHPMGPFRLMDLTGIDLAYDIGMERFRQTGDPADRPPPTVVAKFVKGEWGEKFGKGFYKYPDTKAAKPPAR